MGLLGLFVLGMKKKVPCEANTWGYLAILLVISRG